MPQSLPIMKTIEQTELQCRVPASQITDILVQIHVGGDCWKADVEIWGAYTKDEKGECGPAVYLSLQGEAREYVQSASTKPISVD